MGTTVVSSDIVRGPVVGIAVGNASVLYPLANRSVLVAGEAPTVRGKATKVGKK